MIKPERGWMACFRLAAVSQSGRTRRKLPMLWLLSFVALFTVSCAIIPTRDKVGGVLFSINSVGLWEDIEDVMSPRFSLASGDEALTKVVPATAYLQQQILNSIGISAGVAAVGTSLNPVSIGTNAAINALPPSLAMDPQLQYRTAASLYQNVQLINNEVRLAAKQVGCVPYLVQMQLTHLPYHRRQPYDIHAAIEFFPCGSYSTDKDGKEHLPYVIPLIATDSLERSTRSSIHELVAHLNLEANPLMNGANVKANAGHQNRKSALGNDINSLMTVARLNNNGIYVRIGAANSITGEYRLVGRTYNIACLMLVPKYYFGSETNKQPTTARSIQLAAISHTTLRGTNDGTPVQPKSSRMRARDMDTIFKTTLPRENYRVLCERTTKIGRDDLGATLVGCIQTGNVDEFFKTCKYYHISTGFATTLWTRLALAFPEKETISAFVELPFPSHIKDIPPQKVLLRDDRKEKTEAILHSVSGITSPSDVSAFLSVCTVEDMDMTDIPAASVAVDPTTHTLSLTFPSLEKWGIAGIVQTNSWLSVTFPLRQSCTQTNVQQFGIMYVRQVNSQSEFPTNKTVVTKEQTGFSLTANVVIEKPQTNAVTDP